MTDADRMRVYRRRQRNGRAVFHFEFDDIALTEALIADGFLRSDQIDDPFAVKAALERMVAAFVLDADA